MTKRLVIGLLALVVIGAGLGLGLGLTGSTPVQSAASSAHLTRVSNCGTTPPGLHGGVFAVPDSGAGWRDGVKYGIATFSSTAQLKRWIAIALTTTGATITPVQTGSTWVVYRALTQSGTACPRP